MTNCTQQSFSFPACKRRAVEANFEGGDITSDAGVLLLRQLDRRVGLCRAVASALVDPRRQASCLHEGVSLLQQRVYGLALGYEDLNDHDRLRQDLALWPNQFRLLLSSLAYILLETLRRLALKGTELSRAYVGTLRLKLLKIGAVILRNTRRIRLLLSSSYPYQDLFFLVAHKLAPG